MRTWLVVADSARSRFFRLEKQTEVPRSVVQQPMNPVMQDVLIEIEELFHPLSRQHDRDFASDEPGFSSVAGMRSKFGMDEKISPKAQEEIRFSQQVNQVLLAQIEHFDALILIAPPHFLGLLRSHLDERVLQKITRQFDKDLSRLSVNEIQAHLTQLTG